MDAGFQSKLVGIEVWTPVGRQVGERLALSESRRLQIFCTGCRNGIQKRASGCFLSDGKRRCRGIVSVDAGQCVAVSARVGQEARCTIGSFKTPVTDVGHTTGHNTLLLLVTRSSSEHSVEVLLCPGSCGTCIFKPVPEGCRFGNVFGCLFGLLQCHAAMPDFRFLCERLQTRIPCFRRQLNRTHTEFSATEWRSQ